MSWLDAVFRKKITTDDCANDAYESVSFDGDARPAWATPTGLYRAVGQSTGVAVREPWTAEKGGASEVDAKPLPRRTSKRPPR